MEDSGDGVGVGDDLEDTHAAAAFSAAGDVDGEDAGEELCPRDASWPRRGAGRGSGRVVGEGEVQRELRRWRRCGGLGDDVLTQAVVAGEAAAFPPASSGSARSPRSSKRTAASALLPTLASEAARLRDRIDSLLGLLRADTSA